MTAPKIKPATPLPWMVDNGTRIYADATREIAVATKADPKYRYNSENTAAYIVAACNAYPKLVEALRELSEAGKIARTGAQMSYDVVQRADALLRSLGEE